MMKRIGSTLLLVAVAACGPANQSVVEVGEPVPMTPEAAGGGEQLLELAFEGPLEVKGVIFAPNALDLPELPGNGTTVKRSIADQRKKAAKSKGAAKAADAKDLALLLWYTYPQGDAKEAKKQLKAQREEALGILAGLAADAKAGEEIHAAYAAAEHAVGDKAKAAAAWDKLITSFPQSKALARYRALRNYIAFEQRQELPHPLPESLDGAPYEAAYVAAWVAFRSGDDAKAIAALSAAAKGWTNLESMVSLRRDVMLFFSRRGGNPAEASAIVLDLAKKDQGDAQKIASALADAYVFAGEYEAAAGLWEQQTKDAAPATLAELRLKQALVHYRLVRPTEAADATLAAWDALGKAGDAAPAELKEGIARQMVNFAMIFHSEYAKTHDARFAEPAKKLYTAYVGIQGRPDAAKVKDELLPNLEQTIKTLADAGAGAAVGTLDSQIVDRHVKAYLEQVGVCYEARLQGNPTLAMTGVLTLKIGKDGTVTDATVLDTKPADAKPAADCVATRAKAWKFPTSGVASKVAYPMSFAPNAK